MNKNPCSICEDYIKGIRCDNDKCPVYQMKRENARLKRKLNNTDDGLWEWEEKIKKRTYEMGQC